MERRRLAAVIVNYRTPDLTLDAMDSLLPQLDPLRDEILLVDNASPDASMARLEAGLLERGADLPVCVVQAPQNRGFSAGVNLGLEWTHRLFKEPRRLAKRYLVRDLPFAIRLLTSALARRSKRWAGA